MWNAGFIGFGGSAFAQRNFTATPGYAAEAGEIEPFIVLNKPILVKTALWRERLAFYQDLGYPLIEVSVKRNVEPFAPLVSRLYQYFSGAIGYG